jgi:hypothetical protein
MNFQPYNKKVFLLPDSINSAAMYHAKLFPDGKYIFRIHDCLGGIRLIGELKAESDFVDAVNKLQALADAAQEFAFYIFHLSQEKPPEGISITQSVESLEPVSE